MRRLKKIWSWIDDRSGFTEIFKPLMEHPVPPGSRWSYVFGSATLFCLVLQVITGVALSLLYQPSASGAYESLYFITHQAVMGRWLRGIHYFGASAMIIMAGAHMMRVYITAAYKYPREMSWISGVVLLLLTVMMGFTGQLLRWDSNGVWSSVVAAEQLGRIPIIGTLAARWLLGGSTIGGHTLSRFFSYHVFIIPAFIFLFVAYHLMLVVRNGISEPPKAGRPVDPSRYRAWYKQLLEKEGVPFWPYAAWRDAVFSVITIIAILCLALIYGPPELTQPPDPSFVYTTPRPDWYMLAIFSLFALMPPRIESYAIFIGPILMIIILLSVPFIAKRGERSPIRRPWAVFGVVCVTAIVFNLLMLGIRSPWAPNFEAKPLTKDIIRSQDTAVVRGATLFYEKGCLYCHKIKGKGGLTGPDLTLAGLRMNATEMNTRIVNGGDDMPAYGGMLKHDELAALVVFLQSRR